MSPCEIDPSDWKARVCHPGVLAALGAALLFGTSTPFAKSLLASIDPWLLAGLLYLGSGLGLSGYRLLRRAPPPMLSPGEWPWLVGALVVGGVVGPVLLMFGLAGMPATGASLLLNAESVFTALLAWFAFRENFDRRIALGMGAIVAGAAVLSWPDEARFSGAWPALAVLGACLAWGIDNNLTRKVSLAAATWIAALKGLVAGGANLALAILLGASWPPGPSLAGALAVGCLAYGVSLVLFVIGLRHLGAARAGAYFSVAPFFGAVLAIPLLHESISARLLIAGALMAFGVWLHLTEQHSHAHTHDALEHEHEHEHDEHHRHAHDEPELAASSHSHLHRHEPITHIHPHFPDAHHRHLH
jgi:drug/metabolite transporter (DMT)-like permease